MVIRCMLDNYCADSTTYEGKYCTKGAQQANISLKLSASVNTFVKCSCEKGRMSSKYIVIFAVKRNAVMKILEMIDVSRCPVHLFSEV